MRWRRAEGGRTAEDLFVREAVARVRRCVRAHEEREQVAPRARVRRVRRAGLERLLALRDERAPDALHRAAGARDRARLRGRHEPERRDERLRDGPHAVAEVVAEAGEPDHVERRAGEEREDVDGLAWGGSDVRRAYIVQLPSLLTLSLVSS
jgi:hypothetical protein